MKSNDHVSDPETNLVDFTPARETLFEDLAKVVTAVGSPDFFEKLAKCIASTLGSSRYLTLRYARYSKPQFLVNTAMSDDAVNDYLDTYYRIDPILRMVRYGTNKQVVTFDQLKQSGSDTLFYDQMYRSARIFDELAFLMPTAGGVWTAITVDRCQSVFTQKEIDNAWKIFPLISQLHALHVDKCIFGWQGGYLDDSEIALMLVDAEGNPAFRNNLWKNKVSDQHEYDIIARSLNRTNGVEEIEKSLVVHWETLDNKNAVAPGGKAYLLEENSPGYLDLAARNLVDEFSTQYNLTPREREITEFILKGHPPALIAETLGVSVGTVRNHKHRLYYKLDITTERELFSTFFKIITKH